MDVEMPKPGTYVAAISGGVDSMALLHYLVTYSDDGMKLVVAHLDHGIRPDSAEDRQLVQAAATDYGLPFIYKEARLGKAASEAEAREVRYAFLHDVQNEHGAAAILTAHHQDDVLETAIINLVRGTGRKGLTALGSRPGLLRPLLKVPKSEILHYAHENNLKWREDSTNADERYLRNYVRRQILPRFDVSSRQKLLALITAQRGVNSELDELLAQALQSQPGAAQLDRGWFNRLPHQVALDVMAAWLRANDIRDFDRKTLERLVIVAKVTYPGKRIDILKDVKLTVSKEHLALTQLER